MRSIALLFGLLQIIGSANICIAEVVTLERSLKRLRSDAAKESATRFLDAKQKLAKTYEKQLKTLRLELTTNLEAALKDATDAKDYSELQRVMDARSALQNSKLPILKEKEGGVENLKKEIALLQKRLPSLELIEKQILGNWTVEANKYSSEWEFTKDHIVLLNNDPRGKWEVDLKSSRVLIIWSSENRWDSLHFPFHGGQTSGDSWFAPNVLSAKKTK